MEANLMSVLRHNFMKLLPVFCLLPYATVYLINLLQLPHYQFAPLVLLAFAYFLWERRDRFVIENHNWMTLGISLISVPLALASALFASPWLGYLAMLLAAAAFLGILRDKLTRTGAMILLLPLALLWQPPYSTDQTGDTILITRLQQVSAVVSSQWLDLLGFVHFRPGTVLEFPGKSFGVAEACSGVQSFFALLCFASLLIVFQRRGLIHACLLLASSVLWAILMNTVRITAIPVAYELFQFDLSEGLVHDILGYSTMGIALLLLVSSDYLLLSLLPDRATRDLVRPTAGTVAISPPSGATHESTRDCEVPGNANSFGWQHWLIAAPFALVFVMQLQDVASSWGQQRKNVNFFRGNVLLDVEQSDAPNPLGNWQLESYRSENRERGADLGERSSIWNYRQADQAMVFSFDQAFPGWHELPVCYTLVGWSLQERIALAGADNNDWGYVIAKLKRGNAEYGYLVFSLFDSAGKPLAPPGQWDTWTALKERIQNRLSPTVRGSLFSLAAYQVQSFVPSSRPLSQEEEEAILAAFLQGRESLRASLLSN